jgi:glutaredoxin-like protein NrdH
MNITVYTKPNCVQCHTTKTYLDKHNFGYSTVDITKDQEAYEKVVGLGFSSVPVVITDTDSWSGFRVSKLEQMLAQRTSKASIPV